MEDRSAWMRDDRKKDRWTTVALRRETTEFIGIHLFVHLPSSLTSGLQPAALSCLSLYQFLNSTIPFILSLLSFLLSAFLAPALSFHVRG